MRKVFGGLVMAFGVAAVQPAFATDAATTGAAPTLATAAEATSLAVLPMVLADAAMPAEVPGAAFRLAPLSLPAVATKSAVATTDLVAGLHRRFTGSMMEYYPFAGSGFHLSGGARLFQRRNFLAETADSARGALSVTHVTMQTAVTRAGFRRFNPVATAGYTRPLGQMMQVGVEAGAMMSRAFAGTPGLSRHSAAFRGENGFRPDAIANLVFGMHF